MATATLARSEVDVDELINPLPSQAQVLRDQYRYKYVLFGGAAGPGKSHILRWAAVDFLIACAAEGHCGVRVGLFCEDYPSLKDRQVTKIRREFPPWLGLLRGSQEEGFGFYLHDDYGGGAIMLRNLDKPQKYASAEFAAEYVDELTKNSRETFDHLRFRLRWPGIDHSPFVAASNPGSMGHAWVKKLWVDRDFTGDDEAFDPGEFVFVPALPADNPYLPESYWQTLNTLPEPLRRAMRDGDWSVFAGQMFSEFRRHLHVVKPFTIAADWVRWRAVDYGFAAPFCCHWFARSPDRQRLAIYRELHKRELTATDQAKAIGLASGTEPVRLTTADPSMWARTGHAMGKTVADEYAEAGVPLRKANNDRKAGWGALHEALAWKEIDGRLVQPPRLQVFDTCMELIKALGNAPRDEIDPEDVHREFPDDHPLDSCRYGLMAERRVEERVPQVRGRIKRW